jgi:thymidine kinase
MNLMGTSKSGNLILILGPMFAGKSTRLLEMINDYNVKGKKTIVIKYDCDNRYSDEDKLVTHDRKEYPATPANAIQPLIESLSEYDVIAIDEGQFYSDVIFV